MVGQAWLDLASELEAELRVGDPGARVRVGIDASGLLKLDVTTDRAHLAEARLAARRYEERAVSVCETCGGEVAAVQAGPVLTVLCRDCVP